MKTREELLERAKDSTGAIQVGFMLKLILEVLIDMRDQCQEGKE